MGGFTLQYSSDQGLTARWMTTQGFALEFPVRVLLKGHHIFTVWGVVDSGESAPVWAESDLVETFFGSHAEGTEITYQIEHLTSDDGNQRYLVIGESARAKVMLEFRNVNGELQVALHIAATRQALPLCYAEVRFDDLAVGDGAQYVSAHAYGGKTHNAGAVAALNGPGVRFIHGCTGLSLPLVYLYTPTGGLQCEFMVDGRPEAWLRPSNTPEAATWAVTWAPDRLLLPGQVHDVGGPLRFAPFTGSPIAMLRNWRDQAAARLGVVSPATPTWARKMQIVEFNMNPANTLKDFTRLDDSHCRALLERWRAMGYTDIYCVSDNHVGQNWLSPLDYEPCDAVGGYAAEQQFLHWAKALGFHTFLWVTTVGIDRGAPEVQTHPEWFTHRSNGDLFYAWESHAPDYIGYAPDADPLSTGWRGWLKAQVQGIIARGYDGIFVDGCIPRASNHACWLWPGEARNGVTEQVEELAAYVRTLGDGLITFVEDENLRAQAACEVTLGRYVAMPPFVQVAHYDQGMGGGPESGLAAPARIAPEEACDYLRVRYASLLPGVVSNDIVEGYHSEAMRPWVVQSLLAGAVPKTHSEYVDDPLPYRPWPACDDPSPDERRRERRQQGYEEFIRLLQFCRDEPLIHEAPLSIEAVEVEGDAAVVGFLRPTAERCLLVLMHFANRPAHVTVRLVAPMDVPMDERTHAGQPHLVTWTAEERLHSMVDTTTDSAELGPALAMPSTLAPYGFRIYELRRSEFDDC